MVLLLPHCTHTIRGVKHSVFRQTDIETIRTHRESFRPTYTSAACTRERNIVTDLTRPETPSTGIKPQETRGQRRFRGTGEGPRWKPHVFIGYE